MRGLALARLVSLVTSTASDFVAPLFPRAPVSDWQHDQKRLDAAIAKRQRKQAKRLKWAAPKC